ncbi:MAG: carboxypeptidase-like regulatory domain-containing protein, partial [Muribaculaceae bacterium]|nr:carboxypeptidase-like regulatory domain-containing protein [Muribaculaceae bacterium]
MRIKGLLALLTLVGFSSLSTTFSANAEIIISGIVVNENKEPVDVATTRLVDASGKTRFFRSTDENGRFQFTIDTLKWNGTLLVECLGYAPASREIATDRSIRDITVSLSQKATELKEVVVTAPNVRVLGDTVSYRLSAFAGKGDVTLKDAMRNLPGIDIADNGKIKYLGKDISNFYIEGMDLLGGKYNV